MARWCWGSWRGVEVYSLMLKAIQWSRETISAVGETAIKRYRERVLMNNLISLFPGIKKTNLIYFKEKYSYFRVADGVYYVKFEKKNWT
jgi:hypothetical protein